MRRWTKRLTLTQGRWRRGRDDDETVPFASVNKFDWGGGVAAGAPEVHGVEMGSLSEAEFRKVVERVVPQADVIKVGERTMQSLSEDEVVMPPEDPLRKLADLTADKLSHQSTHDQLLSDFPELQNLPGMSHVLGRYREQSPTEQRVMEGIIDDSLAVSSPQDALFEREEGREGLVSSGVGHFSPEVRMRQIKELTAQLTNSNLHTLPPELETIQAAKLHELSPWEYEVEEPPLPDEYWQMSSAERRFLGLPYKGPDGKWNPPQATFTARAAQDINLKAFRGIMDKVRKHGGSKEQLVKEEVAMLREAEDKIFDHLKARLEDMAPFLDERSKVWRKRRE
eukprot:TRINITY_DN9856_c0_g1_i1.p1 TRINITY_DN9856_c0_g1~~TRINITY_DN9856_c0_g1_i1.p1  ORF type:complete len:339 (+),score=28.44 TRINITY_DN9856_c0_g1_i1:182-1198(+)